MGRVLAALVLVAAAALGAIQFASDAILSQAAQPVSLPAHLPASFGVAVYRRLSAIAQAPFVDAMLARAALARGDTAQAETYAQRLPDSAVRDDLLALIAQARGDERAAQRYFVRAGDIEAVDRAVDSLQAKNPARAYALESALARRLERSGTHPDAVAEAYWRLGTLASAQSKLQLALNNFRTAIALSPFSEKYLLAGGFTAFQLHDDALAQRYFVHVLAVNPASADGYAGAGMVALRSGDRAQAQADLRRALALDPHSHAAVTLQAALER